MEYEIILVNETIFAYGIKELKATLQGIDTAQVQAIWKNVKYNGTCENVTEKYI